MTVDPYSGANEGRILSQFALVCLHKGSRCAAWRTRIAGRRAPCLTMNCPVQNGSPLHREKTFPLSRVADLRERIETLNDEIVRAEAMIAHKEDKLGAAEAFFKKA